MTDRMIDKAIEALIEKRVREDRDTYNDRILRKMKYADDGSDPNFKRFAVREWFRLYVMENDT